jgi:hypothetical protein
LLYAYRHSAKAYADEQILALCVVYNMAKYRKFCMHCSNSVPSSANAIIAGGHFILKAEYDHYSRELQKIKGGKAKLNYRQEVTSRGEKRKQVSIVTHEEEILLLMLKQEGYILSSWYERYTLDQIQEVERIRDKRYSE